MTPNKIFKLWAGMDCSDLLYNYKTESLYQSIDLEPKPSMWNTYIFDDKEIEEKDLDIFKEYESAFFELKESAETIINDLCYSLTIGESLHDLLEDVFYDYLDQDIYNKFHKIIDDFDKGYYSNDEMESMDDLYDSKDKSNHLVLLALFSLVPK
jgi:hypothetical protein